MADVVSLIRQTGIIPDSEENIIPDGKIRRFRIVGHEAGSKNGAYMAIITPNGTVKGFVQNWKTMEKYNFTSGKLNSEDQNYIKQMQLKHKEDLHTRQKIVADEVAKFINSCVPAKPSQYTIKKRLDPVGLLTDGRAGLIMPIYNIWDEVVSYQRIYDDGKKLYKKHGQKMSCFGKLEPLKGVGYNNIFIAEGWATGRTVNLATGCPVMICLDAYNIKPVVSVLKNKFPVSKIIVAADNDQWTVLPNGRKVNPGIKGASESGAHSYIYPKFSSDDPKKRTDWDDWRMDFGLDSVREHLLNV